MEDRKLITKTGMFVDLLLTALFFVFMAKVCMGHAPAQTETVKMIVGAFCAVPIAGTFWLALGLFRVTVADFCERRRQGKDF